MIANYKKYFGKQNNIENWKVFFDYFGKEHKILDFGCGSAWSIHLGRELGYDIVGVDTYAIGRFKVFNDFRKNIGVDNYVKLYSGSGELPFEDDSFSLIVCRASFNKFHNRSGIKDESMLAIERLKEFDRITYKSKNVVITGKYFKNEFKQFDFKVFNWKKGSICRLWN